MADESALRFYSVLDAKARADAAGAKVSLKTFTTWVANGTVPSVRIGGRRFVLAQEFDALMCPKADAA
jgi:hypothetical protein